MSIGAPKVLIGLVLLLGWCPSLQQTVGGPFQFFEVFSGHGNCSKYMYQKGYACASYDKDYATAGHRQSCMNYLEPSGYVLALLVAMAMVPAGLVLLAPDCGSWGIPSRYTSMRTYHNAMGCPEREFVDRGNVMISRTV
eukprot:s3978_g3.t1